MKKLLIQIHSCVDVITNSSSELFTVHGDVKIVKEYINEYLKNNKLNYSGMGGDISVKPFRNEIQYFVNEANKRQYHFCDDDDFHYYEYELLETEEEKFSYILKDYCDSVKKYSNQIIDINDIDKMVLIDIDYANQELITELKNTFPNVIKID